MLPEGRVVRVRGVQVHGRDVTSVSAPSRAAVNLGSVDAHDLARGVTLVDARRAGRDASRWTRASSCCTTRGRCKHGARVRVHHGTAERLGRVAVCAVSPDGGREWTLAAVGESSVVRQRRRTRLRAHPPRTADGAHARRPPDSPHVLATRDDRRRRRPRSAAADSWTPAARHARAVQGHRCRVEAGDRRLRDSLRVWLEDAGERGLTAPDLVARGGLGPEASRVALAVAGRRGSRRISGDARVRRSGRARLGVSRRQCARGVSPRAAARDRGAERGAARARGAAGGPGARRACPAVDDVARRDRGERPRRARHAPRRRHRPKTIGTWRASSR